MIECIQAQVIMVFNSPVGNPTSPNPSDGENQADAYSLRFWTCAIFPAAEDDSMR
jgi:hypothetical protein